MRLIKTLAAGVAASLLFAMPAMAQGAGEPHLPRLRPQPKAGAAEERRCRGACDERGAAGRRAGAAIRRRPAAAISRSGAPAAWRSRAGGSRGGGRAGLDPGKAGAPAGPGASPRRPGRRPAMDGPTYAVRLRDLEQRIDELKEQIRRSHTRLSLLSDTILSGGGAGSRASIKFNNELSSAFRVTRVLVVLDGAVQYNKTDQSGTLAEQAEIPIFNGSVPPGDHTLQVLVNLQGNGYGVFSYLRGYRFEVGRATRSPRSRARRSTSRQSPTRRAA